ncbi:HAD family hydrolase, partial [Corynebacterium sanguinis]|uniref:HAD family hydrolase n=2 Tax=Corynebacterium sanguinis TaxID=2594913 RepID=UPI0021A6E64E
QVFAELVQAYELNLDADDVWAAYRRQMPHLVSCADVDRAALRDLRGAGWKVGIVTNGLVDNQEGKIRQLGLDALLDGWVISAEVGVRKPARRIFEILASRLACPLNGWMIGDSVEIDVMGGRAAGLRTAHIARDGSAAVSSSADIVTTSVAEAAALILTEPS